MMKLTKRNTLLMGLTLFSMFFGAGNLIFPPFLGNQAGSNTWIAMAGFAVTAIGFPVLGVAAVAEAGGLNLLAKRVHPVFAAVFTLLMYLSIGPGLAIPRTASTSFEMSVQPFLPAGFEIGKVQLLYSFIFFLIAFLVAMKPEMLSESLGKILTPCLLILITVIFLCALFYSTGGYGSPVPVYEEGSFAKGFLEGYQTMDTIAALIYGIVISIGIQAKGVKEEKQIVKETIKSGFIAGILLLIIYSALGHLGAIVSADYQHAENGAQVLTYIVSLLFGETGLVILGIIFFIACLNCCVGLLCSCSEYFAGVSSKISYRMWLVIFAGISFLVSNLGLSRILKISVPILNVIYPMAIVLIALAFLHPYIQKWNYVYPFSVLTTGLVSILYVAESIGIKIGGMTEILHRLPLYEQGLMWIIPAIFGAIVGIFLSMITGGNRTCREKK